MTRPTRRCGSVYLGVVVLRVCEICYMYEGYVGSAVVSRRKQITFKQCCFSDSRTLHESLQEGCIITVFITLPEFRKMTARVMHKLRVALQMSCTRAVSNKSFEAIWRDEQCLRRASQRCFNATWKRCRSFEKWLRERCVSAAGLIPNDCVMTESCISDCRLRSDYTAEENIGCKNKLIAVEKSDLI